MRVPSTDDMLRNVFVSVAAALLVASVLGTVAMFKQTIEIQGWIVKHEEVASIYIQTIQRLSNQADKGDRWTRQMHEEYESQRKSDEQDHERRIAIIESEDRVTKYQLLAMNKKLDEILANLKSHK